MDRRSWLLLLGTALAWGSSFMFIKVAVADVSPAGLTFARCALGAAVLWAIVAAGRSHAGYGGSSLPHGRREWLGMLAVGALTGIPFTLIGWAEQGIDSGVAGIANASTPLWATVLAVRFDRDHPAGRSRWVGVAIGFAGVALLLSPGDPAGHGEVTRGAGLAAMLLGALCYAIGGVTVRATLTRLAPPSTAAWSCTVPAIALLPWVVLGPGDATPATLAGLASVLVLGIVATGLGLHLYYLLLARVGAARASMVTYLLPPMAVAWGATLLGERPAPTSLAAMVVILLGIWLGSRPGGSAVGPPPTPAAAPAADPALPARSPQPSRPPA